MVITVYYDPENPDHSSKKALEKMQDGIYGSFYSARQPMMATASPASVSPYAPGPSGQIPAARTSTGYPPGQPSPQPGIYTPSPQPPGPSAQYPGTQNPLNYPSRSSTQYASGHSTSNRPAESSSTSSSGHQRRRQS